MIIEEGVYGDGSFGLVHVYERVFETAYELGWSPSPEDMELIESYPRDWEKYSQEENEEYNMIIDELIESAVDYLNSDHSDSDHYWGFENGDFGFSPLNRKKKKGGIDHDKQL